MDSLLKLLRENAALSTEDLAGMLSLSEDEVSTKIRQAQSEGTCLLYTSPSPRDMRRSRMPSSA